MGRSNGERAHPSCRGGRVVDSWIVELGREPNTDELMQRALRQGLLANDYLTQENFPINPVRVRSVRIVGYDPDRDWYSFEEGRQILRSAGIGVPTYEHGLQCLVQHGISMRTDKRKPAFFHDPWHNRGTGRFLYLCDLFEHLEIALDCIRGQGDREDQVFGPNRLLAGILLN